MQRREGRFRRIRQFNRTQLAIFVAAVTLIVTLFFPRFYPAARQGPGCRDLAQPLGGNNRSVIAHRSDQTEAIDLDLELGSRIIGTNGDLEVILTFINDDDGPVILHIPDQEAILTNNPAVQGITFDITSVNNTVTVASQPGTYSPPPVFTGADFETLHLLGAYARCHMLIEINAETLQSIGVVPGQDYRIQAYYRNTSAGDLPQANIQAGGNITATPFPEYVTQGVWTGTAISEEARFNISTTQPVQPAQ